MAKRKPYYCSFVINGVRNPAFTTIEAHGYEDAFDKIYPQIASMPDDTEVAIYTERSGTGYSFNLGRWRPFDAAQHRVQATVLTHLSTCALVRSLVADCNCDPVELHSA